MKDVMREWAEFALAGLAVDGAACGSVGFELGELLAVVERVFESQPHSAREVDR